MRSTQQLGITLPNDMAAMVKAKVAPGDYASVVPAAEALKADPGQARTSGQVRADLARQREAVGKKA